MVQPMRKPPPYYARYAERLSPAARVTWDALREEGNRHWLFDQAWQCKTLEDPALALVAAELQSALIDGFTHPWRSRRRRQLIASFDVNFATAHLA